jgi:hypothetical protein
MVVAVQFARFTTQKLQWQSFADTSEINLFPDGQYAAGSGRAELLKNSRSDPPIGLGTEFPVLSSPVAPFAVFRLRSWHRLRMHCR